MFPNSPWTNVNDSVVVVIFSAGRLGFVKFGARSFAIVDDNSFEYDDICMFLDPLKHKLFNLVI